MCGIVGAIALGGKDIPTWVEPGTDKIVHRGPDAGGLWLDPAGKVAFGHRRLSIIDLSEAGAQPMHSSDGKLSIVFNGEIYNFQEIREALAADGQVFRSHSDTEVMIYAYRKWGKSFVERLNGMFAFALYDHDASTVFFARDRAGEKPLYYGIWDSEFVFSSELKAFQALKSFKEGSKVNLAALDYALAYGYVPESESIFESIHKVLPGEWKLLDISTGKVESGNFWKMPSFQPSSQSDEALLDELDELLNDSIRRQLIADVPVGVFLSGGVDSSLVTAIASKYKPNLKTFNVRFSENPDYDESKYASAIAEHFGTDHLILEAKSLDFSTLKRLAVQFDEPMVDSSMIPTYQISSLVKEYCTVAIGGDGGDELFAGYKQYNALLQAINKVQSYPSLLRKPAAWLASQVFSADHPRQFWFDVMKGGDRYSGSWASTFFNQQERDQLYTSLNALDKRAESVRRAQKMGSGTFIQANTAFDFRQYMANDVLVKVDRASMLASLEVRAPLLDYRIVEFAFSKVPDRLKSDGTDRKILLRRLAKRYLPEDFDITRKQGFGVPIDKWLRSKSNYPEIEALFNRNKTFLNREILNAVLKSDGQGERLFALVMVELWAEAYSISR